MRRFVKSGFLSKAVLILPRKTLKKVKEKKKLTLIWTTNNGYLKYMKNIIETEQ